MKINAGNSLSDLYVLCVFTNMDIFYIINSKGSPNATTIHTSKYETLY